MEHLIKMDKIEGVDKVLIKQSRPPEWVWREAHKVFEIDDSETIYTYGDTIFDSRGKGNALTVPIIAHEMTHVRQQKAIGGPDIWWKKYLEDPEFRKWQEIEAYRVQYVQQCQITKDRNTRARYLNILATYASSPLYKMNLSHSDALKLIRNGQ